MESLLILGGGGHARSVMDTVVSSGTFPIRGIVDSGLEKGSLVLGFPVLGGDELGLLVPPEERVAALGVGQVQSAEVRKRVASIWKGYGARFPVLVSSTGHVSTFAVVGAGTIVFHHGLINAGSQVGQFCIINSGALVDHDVTVGDFTHISAGAVLGGGAIIGNEVFVGSGAVVFPRVEICSGVVIGAGGVVTKAIREPGTYIGNPLRYLGNPLRG